MPTDADPPAVETHVLDTRGDYCPLPLLKLRRTAARLEEGAILVVWSTDPLATLDFEAWCLREGHDYTALPDAADHQRTRIQLGAARAQ
ncbi:MAG: sulfurtransferase TusA family protein [Xanthomonadales bacterium]|jgi:tRNA 2-thiouridine synthesizing protein A|nr:sulfurtransferase TusA family protein [Xanthomonadales bacterium]